MDNSSKKKKKASHEYKPNATELWYFCWEIPKSKSVVSENSMNNDAEVQNAVVLLFLWFLCAVLDCHLFCMLDKKIHTYRQRGLCSRENTKKEKMEAREWKPQKWLESFLKNRGDIYLFQHLYFVVNNILHVVSNGILGWQI